MIDFKINRPNQDIITQLRKKIDQKTKPLNSLGMLEALAIQIGAIQQTLNPKINNPTILVFAGDHGIAAEGVSAYPSDVTAQMVLNFLNGGAAINVFTKQHDLELKIIDAGVNYDFDHPDMIDAKVRKGSRNFLCEDAMSTEELSECFTNGAAIVDRIVAEGCNVIGFGEMGIGNTSSASILMSQVCHLPMAQCVGAGTGLDKGGQKNKLAILEKALARHGEISDPLKLLQAYGGLEIAQMTAGMLRAAACGVTIIVDGFISTAAFLVATKICPEIADYAIISHCSNETGHFKMLQHLGMSPVLDLKLRLGEGTGCALAYPLIQSSLNFLNEMASFESAQVSVAL